MSEWHELQRAERREHLAAFLKACRVARERGEEWVRWLDSGRPAYTRDEYAASVAERERRRPARSRSSA